MAKFHLNDRCADSKFSSALFRRFIAASISMTNFNKKNKRAQLPSRRKKKNFLNSRLLSAKLTAMVPTALTVTLVLTLVSMTFKVNAITGLIENTISVAQEKVEQKVDSLVQGPPLDGVEWPGGDLNPHHDLLFQTWRFNGTHRSGRDPRLAPLTCRLYHVCQYSDGSLILPEAMRPYERQLKSCGVKNYFFANQANRATKFDHSHGMNDLVSAAIPPHSSDPAGQLLFVNKIIFAQYVTHQDESSSTIDYRFYSVSGSRSLVQALRPVMYTREQALRPVIGEDGSEKIIATWESLVVDKLKNSMADFEVHGFYDAFPRLGGKDRWTDPKSSQDFRAVCFHSIVSTGEAGDELPKKAMLGGNPFFNHNNIDRTARWQVDDADGASTAKPSARVRSSEDGYLNVLIISDWISRVDQKLISESIAQRLKDFSPGSKVVLEPRIIHLKVTAAVSDLFTVFHKADIVIAPQSAILNNVLYMREKSLLVEVFPYSEKSEVYKKIAGNLSVNYLGIMALPDTKTFQKCLEDENERLIDSDIKLLRRWNLAAKEFKNGNRKSYVDLKGHPRARRCVRKQLRRKLVNIDPIMRAIFDRVVIPRISS